jgi:hypothetical protein
MARSSGLVFRNSQQPDELGQAEYGGRGEVLREGIERGMISWSQDCSTSRLLHRLGNEDWKIENGEVPLP